MVVKVWPPYNVYFIPLLVNLISCLQNVNGMYLQYAIQSYGFCNNTKIFYVQTK